MAKQFLAEFCNLNFHAYLFSCS